MFVLKKYLDKIYIIVLKQSICPAFTDEEKESYKILRYILRSIADLFSSLSVNSLIRLLNQK